MQPGYTIKTRKLMANPALVKDTNSAATTNRSILSSSSKASFKLETPRIANSSAHGSPRNFQTTSIFHKDCLTSNDARTGNNNASTQKTLRNKVNSSNNFSDKNKMSKVAQPTKTNQETRTIYGEKRQEIEKLKTELTSLINTNLIKSSPIKQSSTNLIIPVPEAVSENVEKNIASPIVKQNTVVLNASPTKTTHSPPKMKPKQPPILKNEANVEKTEPKSKIKHYDSKTTQEFIKKQKTQRKLKEQEEQLKKKECEELKKLKLQELRQKSLQLLNKNVQKSAKKTRAKSSETRISAQPSAQDVNNKASPHFLRSSNSRPGSVDREAANNVNRRSFGQQSELRPWRRSRSVSREPKPSQRVIPVKLHKCAPDVLISSKPPESDNNEIKECVKKVSSLLEKDIEYNEKNKAATKIQTTFRSYQKRSKEQPATYDVNTHSDNIPDLQKTNIVADIELTVGSLPRTPLIDKKTKDTTLGNKCNIVQMQGKQFENDKDYKSKLDCVELSSKHDSKSHADVKKEIESIKQKLESSISEASARDSKRDKYTTPSWLLPASAVPYPFNFISAVRQKLEIATALGNNSLDFRIKSPLPEKHTKDICIQASPANRKVNASIQCEIEENICQKNVTPRNSPVKADVKSSRSHKCRRKLDVSVPILKSPDSLVESKHSSMNIKPALDLVKSNISVATNHSQSVKNKMHSLEDSDSDTTKNIPEIPEEELRSSLHKSPTKSSVSEYLKNITSSRMNVDGVSSNMSKKSSIKSEFSNHLKNITFDRMKTDHTSSKISSIHSDHLKNITFDRNKVDVTEDLRNLSKPDYHIDTSKVLSRNITEKKSNSSRYPTDFEEYSRKSKTAQFINREKQNSSKYPSDIESILSHYSKRSSWRQSTALNDSNYSEDFNSSIATHSTLPDLKPTVKTTDTDSHKEINSSLDISSEIKTEKSGSTSAQSDGKDMVSMEQHIHSQRTSSSNDSVLKFPVRPQTDAIKSGALSTIPSESGSKHSENTNSTIHSNNKIIPSSHSNSSKVKTNSNDDNAENISASNPVIETTEISNNINSIPKHSTDMTTASQSFIQTSNAIKTFTNGSATVQSVNLKTDSQSVLHAKSAQDAQLSDSNKTDIESRSVLQSSNIPNLTKPTINLKIEKEKIFNDSKNNPNQIHLKFQAQIHLLNSFNKSLQQIVAIDKSLHDTQDKENHLKDEKSFITSNQRVPAISEPKASDQRKFSSVNYKRGYEVTDSTSLMGNLSALEHSVCSQDLGLSQAVDKSSFSATVNSSTKQEESVLAPKNPYVGVSIGMFDQLIKDEDTRLEHFKAVLKLRDKALFDRTKGELAWLEIQKKQSRENGQLSDVTMIKKKQRGLIIKLEQERHEMQRLKQAHKQAAKERKNALREQKNIIKHQLSSTDHIPTKIKRLSRSERRQSGPLKVYRVESRTEHVSETTMSRKSSLTEETVNVTTSSVVTQISERVPSDGSGDVPSMEEMALQAAAKKMAQTEKVREALLMKEAALEKRRKEAEALLEWHRRLKEEETRVAELERQAKSLALEAPEKPRILTGAQLNQIWKGITGQHERKFDEHKKYRMSKKSLDRFYTNARKVFREISEDQSIVSKDDASENSYSAEFEQSESQKMIDNFSLKSNLVSQLNGTNVSSDRIQDVLDTSKFDRIASQKNESSDTEGSGHSTLSERSLVTESGPVITEKGSKLSEDSAHIESDVLDEIRSQMSSNSKKSIILSNISIQEMITSLKNAISACQIKSATHSTIDQISSLEMQDANISASESRISNRRQSFHSSQGASQKTPEISDSQIVSEVYETLSKKVSASDVLSEKYSDIIDSNIISERHEILHKETSDSDIKSDSKVLSVQNTASRTGTQSLISSNLERTDILDNLVKSDIHSEKSTGNIPENTLHSARDSEIQEQNKSESQITTESRKELDTTKTSNTELRSDIQERSQSHIVTESERLTEIPSSELTKSRTEVLSKSGSNLTIDLRTKSILDKTSEIVESNNLDEVVKGKSHSSINSAPESVLETHSESRTSEGQKELSTSIISSQIEATTSALVSNISSEKNSEFDKISKFQETELNLSIKSDVSLDVKENTEKVSSSKIEETIPRTESHTESGLKSSTVTENISQKSEQESKLDNSVSQALVLSDIQEIHTQSSTDILTPELKSAYLEKEILEEKPEASFKDISQNHHESENFNSASHFVSELKSEQTENGIARDIDKDETEPDSLQISEHFESDTQKSVTHISSDVIPTKSENKSTQGIIDIQNKQISEQNFGTETLKSESHIQTQSEGNKLLLKSEDVSFEIKQSDDDIIIEITSKSQNTSSNIEEIDNGSTNVETVSTKYVDTHATNDELISKLKSEKYIESLDQNEMKQLSTETTINTQSHSYKISKSSDAKHISKSDPDSHISDDKSQIPSVSKSDDTIHWSIFKKDSERNDSEFESDVSSEDHSIIQSEQIEDESSKDSRSGSFSSENKTAVTSGQAEETEKEKSESAEDTEDKQDESSNSESIRSDMAVEDTCDGFKKESFRDGVAFLELNLKDLSDNESNSNSEHSEKKNLTPEHEFGGNLDESEITGVSHIDVRKRISEILADATPPRGDKSPRVQDLYITTYDIMSPSPEGTPEIGSPTNEYSVQEKSLNSPDAAASSLRPYTSEAEELLRKQLEIEQEIKRLERQQQDLPYLFVREIPNKPPPPYKPPEFPVTPTVSSVIPVRADQVKTYVDQSSARLYTASVNGTLSTISSDDKINAQRFVFDLCKEIALDVCKPTCDTNVPSWRRPKNTFNSLVCKKPVNKTDLASTMHKKVLQLLNFEPVIRKDSLIVRWSRKKRDHVDEILVLESQTEEAEWINYDVDEQSIKDSLTSEILKSLVSETAQVVNEIMNKKKKLF